MNLGPIGVWSGVLRNGELAAVREAASELEALGYGALWFPGGPPDGAREHIEAMLSATRTTIVAPGIINIWTHPARQTAQMHAELQRTYNGRFFLGLGVSHQHAIQNAGLTYERPLRRLAEYLDEIDGASPTVPKQERIIAALGPRALRLAGERSAGTHPYFTPPEHTRRAREALGPDAIIAPEQMVVLETDAEKARSVARPLIDRYLHAPNYTNNLLRLGFTPDEFENGGSDRVVDAIVAWGDEETILNRVREHHAAGADHVCIQILTSEPGKLPLDGWRRLAQAFSKSSPSSARA
ncbi:MAG: LLM class F420-dependent oxidoreductase [Chloroflexi bacterium]|nr:LLM class F420-dependent oxidoreductase [Chloroflexota bacterium]